MRAQWLKWGERYDALQLRERWLVAVAVLGGIVLVSYSLIIEPALKRSQLAERTMAEQQIQLSAILAQRAALQSLAGDPDEIARTELVGLRKQLSELGNRLEVMENSLVPPQRMSALLEEMIGRKTGLRLLSLKTLPVAPLLDRKVGAEGGDPVKLAEKPTRTADKSATSSAGLFKHGVEIKLEGSYPELTAYLERLEQAKVKLLWSGVALSTEKHPKLVLTLTVFTLSLDRAWLIV